MCSSCVSTFHFDSGLPKMCCVRCIIIFLCSAKHTLCHMLWVKWHFCAYLSHCINFNWKWMANRTHTRVCWCVCKFTLWLRGKWRGVFAKRVLGQVQEPGPEHNVCWPLATRQTCFRHLAYSHTHTYTHNKRRHTHIETGPHTHAHASMSKLSKECVRKYFAK